MRTPLLLILFCLLLPTRADALDMKPIYLGPPFLEGWVPDAEVLRGCIVINGFPMDGRWIEAADFWDFAVLRINSDGYGAKLDETNPDHVAMISNRMTLAKAVAFGLRSLGERTGHPELVNVPLVTTGYSRFSPSAHNFAEQFPGRVLCSSTGAGLKGGTVPAGRTHSWCETPTHWLGCEWENIYNPGNKTTLLKEWRRPAGVTRMVGITWRVYHNPHNHHDVAIQMIDSCIRLRVPADWDPRQGKPTLKTIAEADGWLGSHEGWWIEVPDIPKTNNENAVFAPFSEFTGDKTRASWLVDEATAWAWRAFNSRNPKVQIIAPGMSGIVIHEAKSPPPVLHSEAGVRAGRPFTTTILSHAKNLKTVEIYAGPQKIGDCGPFTGGEMALGSTLQAKASLEATITERGMYSLMAKYTTADGDVGWSRPVPLFVWGADE